MIDLFKHVHQALHNRRHSDKPLLASDRVALFRRVFATDDGERVLTEIAVMAGVFTAVPPNWPADTLRAVEAKRELFADIMRELTATPNEDGTATYLYDHTELSNV